MILECPSCHARYLVPIGSFAGGGRHVRCARCKHLWHASLPTTIDVFVPLPVNVPIPTQPLSSSPSSPLSSSPPTAMPGPSTPLDSKVNGFADNLPALIKEWDWRQKLRKYSRQLLMIVKVIGAFALIVAWPIFDRQQIALLFPQLRGVYEFLHLHINHSGGGLIFEQVISELKYDSGAMKLNIDGVVHNTTDDMEIIPDIKARALGPDNHIIQSWWIAAPAATVEARSDVPFHSEINVTTNHTIENVYLEFYSQDEKKADVAK